MVDGEEVTSEEVTELVVNGEVVIESVVSGEVVISIVVMASEVTNGKLVMILALMSLENVPLVSWTSEPIRIVLAPVCNTK